MEGQYYKALHNQVNASRIGGSEMKYPKTIIDETTGLEVPSELYKAYQDGIREGLARHEYPLDSPCIFCGYNGKGYWQIGTHLKDCPFYSIGGGADREAKIKERRN